MAGGVQIEQRRWCVTVRAPPTPPLLYVSLAVDSLIITHAVSQASHLHGKWRGYYGPGLMNVWSGESRLTGQNWTLPERSKGRDGCQIRI